jgi:hypothetical protein
MITIYTAASAEWKDLIDLTAPNHMEYALRWGLGFHLDRDFHWTTRREQLPSVRRFLAALPENYWLWFQGADVILMDHTRPVDEFLDPTADVAYPYQLDGYINNDNFFLRSHPRVLGFLDSVLRAQSQNVLLDDQEAMFRILKTTDCHIQRLELRHFNPFHPGVFQNHRCADDTYRPGAFAVHLSAMDLGERIEYARTYLKQVKR